MARAAGDEPASSRRWTPTPRTPSAATPFPPATTRSCSTRTASTTWPRWLSCSSHAPCRSTPCSRRSEPATEFPYADYGADLHEGQARFTQPLFDNLLASEWLPAVPVDPRSPQRRSAGARRRRRVRARPVEHRDRPRLPQGHGRRDRPRSGLDRAGSAAALRQAVWRTVWRFTAGTPRIPSCPAATTS